MVIIKRNNPGNIRKNSAFVWQGERPGQEAGAYIYFDTLINGFRAQIKLLNNYILKGTDTLEKIIYKWAPPSDNNPTEKYINFVSEKTEIDRTLKLPTNDFTALSKIALAMAYMEHGIKNDDGSLAEAINEATKLLGAVTNKITSNPVLTAAVILTLYILFLK